MNKNQLISVNPVIPITPICCVLGHVDVGKTKLLDYLRNTKTKEVSGITQQIGTTYFTSDTLEELCGSLAKNLSIPGMIMIDTPGHDCFTTMRYVGAIISHMVVVVVDITKGLEKETINCLNFIKKYHDTNFIIALNKMDRIYGWQSILGASLKKSLDKNKKLMSSLKSYVDKITCDLACQEINACLYYDNKDTNTFVSMVPISASTGEGIPDLIILISKMIEKSTKKLMQEPISKYSFGYFLDNRYEDNLGYFNISVNVNGKLSNGDEIIIVDRDNKNNILSSKVKNLVLSQEGKEMKEKSRYKPTNEINGTQGIGIILTEKNKLEFVNTTVLPGSGSIYGVCTGMLEEQKKELILILQSVITETDSALMCEYDKKEIGIVINAPSMNIISGLIKNLNDENIPISDHYTGKITKDIVIKTSGLYIKSGKEQYKTEYIKKYAVILSFDPVLDHGDDDELLDNMDPIILKMCKESDIRIITGKTVYGLLAKYKKYSDQLDEKFYKKYQNIGGQFKLQILPQFVFLKTTPLMFGVKVIDGEVKIGTTLCAVNDKTKVILGKISSMQKNKKNVELGKINDELCIRIENDQKIVYGDDFDESYIIRRYMTEDEEDIKQFIDKINQQFYL